MARRPKPATENVATWTSILQNAAAELEQKRAEARFVEENLRTCIREAFEAGLTVEPIMAATGLSLGRVYQIKRGVRR